MPLSRNPCWFLQPHVKGSQLWNPGLGGGLLWDWDPWLLGEGERSAGEIPSQLKNSTYGCKSGVCLGAAHPFTDEVAEGAGAGTDRRSPSLATDSELVLPDCLRPRSFTALRRPSLRREADDARLSVSLCDLNVPAGEGEEAAQAAGCPVPQNSLNSQHSRALPPQLDGDLRFHPLRAGAHVRLLDEQTVARLEHGRDERALVFTSRPVRAAETVFVKVTRSGGARPGALSFGVTTCDPGTLRPADLPCSPEALVDRKEFWAVCRVPGPLQSGDILGLVVTGEGELHLSHNGAAAGMQLCVDASQPLWMLFGLHGAITQIRLLGECAPGQRPLRPERGAEGPPSPPGWPRSHTPARKGV